MFKAIDDVFDDSGIEMIGEKKDVQVIIVSFRRPTIYSRFIEWFKFSFFR
jgi:hypothetical protein